MIDIRSSWIVEDGFARPAGAPKRITTGGYHCSACKEVGHSSRVCPMLGRSYSPTSDPRRRRR